MESIEMLDMGITLSERRRWRDFLSFFGREAEDA